jgi:hypothetical protein
MSPVRIEPDRQTSPEKRNQLQVCSLIGVEKNLATLGYFTPSTRRIRDAKKKTIQFNREIDGKKVELRAVILPSAEYGLPITADQDKYLALQKIISDIRQREGIVCNPIGFTSAELLRILGLRVRAGKNYDDIVEWAKRMTLTGICSEGIVYFAGRKIWATDTFHVFDRFVSYGKEMPDGRIADKNYLWLSEWQLENINSNYVLSIDFDAYRQLRNHIAKALVPLLQVWLYATRENGCFEKRYSDFCQILNIHQYPHRSRIIEKLEPSLQELVTQGYLSDWQVRETCDGRGYKLAFYHGSKFSGQGRKQAIHLSQGEDQSSPSTSQAASIPPTFEENSELLNELMERGISEPTGCELLRQLAVGQEVRDQLEWGDSQIQQAPPGKFYNPAGFYIRLIRDNIKPPHNFETSRQRKLREEANKSWQREQDKKAALELAYGRYLDDAVDQYIRKNYSKEFYASSVRSKLAHLLSQDQRLKEKWKEETLYRIAEKRLRQEIATRVPLMPFQEFCERQRQKTNSDRPMCPVLEVERSE